MKFRIIPTQIFIRKVKRYKRKYVNILKDIDKLVDLLRENPKAGVHLKHSVYKIRLKSSDITKGKSGAFRVIYYVLISDGRIYLLTIYSKSEKENISWEEIDDIIKQI